ncbi:aspartic protease precursor, partial [Colletotrichum incanum]
GFWYGSFHVGLSTNLSLLIDTGSSDLAVNPDRYKASSASVNLHQRGVLLYDTVYENGCGFANISYSVFNDTIHFANLTVPIQTFASVKPTPAPDNSTVTQFPHDGIAGLGASNRSRLHATPFFHRLCEQGTIKECRFGLALKRDGTGLQVVGEVDETLFSGPPTAQVMKLFDAAGIQAVNLSLPGCTKVLTGYYQCDNPPAVDFGLSTGSEGFFSIEATAFKQAVNGGNNCTATVAGIDTFNMWIIGQSWFQGKYVDFDVTGKRIGVAQLKDK